MQLEISSRSHSASNASIPYREPSALAVLAAALAAARSRAQSVQSSAQSSPSYSSLPYGSHHGRASWSSREPINRVRDQRTNTDTSMSSVSDSSNPTTMPQICVPAPAKQ